MIKQKLMTNNEIYYLATGFVNEFNGELTLPVKISFYLSKNKKYFIDLAKQIEDMKNTICLKYGTYDTSAKQFKFENNKLEEANKEVAELMALEQEVSYYEISLEDFGDINLSLKQMEILQFMIKEE